MALLTQHEITINVETVSGTFTEIKGITDFTETTNDVVNEYQFLDNNGYSQAEKTGQATVLNLTGIRNTEDDGQNFIFDTKYELLEDAKAVIQFVFPNGSDTTTVQVATTIANVQEFAGTATDGSAISMDFFYNAKPMVTTA